MSCFGDMIFAYRRREERLMNHCDNSRVKAAEKGAVIRISASDADSRIAMRVSKQLFIFVELFFGLSRLETQSRACLSSCY